MFYAADVQGNTPMRDAQGNEIQRGDRLLDANGDVFIVKDTGPVTMHIQNAETGRRYTIGLPVFLKVPFGMIKPDGLSTRRERVAYFHKRISGLRHQMRG